MRNVVKRVGVSAAALVVGLSPVLVPESYASTAQSEGVLADSLKENEELFEEAGVAVAEAFEVLLTEAMFVDSDGKWHVNEEGLYSLVGDEVSADELRPLVMMLNSFDYEGAMLRRGWDWAEFGECVLAGMISIKKMPVPPPSQVAEFGRLLAEREFTNAARHLAKMWGELAATTTLDEATKEALKSIGKKNPVILGARLAINAASCAATNNSSAF